MKTLNRSMPLAFALTLLAVQACGGSASTGSGTVTGTVGGNSLSVGDAVSGVISIGTASTAYVALTSFSNACSTANSNSRPKNVHSMFFFIYDTAATDGNGTAPTAPGTYTITPLVNPSGRPAGKYVTAAFVTFDNACSEGDVYFTSGTANLTKATGGYSATFDFMTDASEHVTGSFAAADCPAIGQAGSSDAGPATCN